MSNVFGKDKRKTLIITEGEDDVNLVKKILFLFPNIYIKECDVIFHGTHLYNLYQTIKKEYGDDWREQDVDLPKLVSEQKNSGIIYEKNNFTNIILIFDYEKQAPNFSEETILEMQDYFSDMNENGLLLINYPMLESYLDIDIDDFDSFKNRRICANITKGNQYKSEFRNGKLTEIYTIFDMFFKEINNFLNNELKSKEIVSEILKISYTRDIKKEIYDILVKEIDANIAKRLSYYFETKLRVFQVNNNFYEYEKEILEKSILAHIRKAHKILGGDYDVSSDYLKEFFYECLDYNQILLRQNESSRDILSGLIWVLNTSIFIVANDSKFWD